MSLLWSPFDQQFGDLIDEFRERRKVIDKEAGLSHMIEAEDARSLQRLNTLQLEKEKKGMLKAYPGLHRCSLIYRA